MSPVKAVTEIDSRKLQLWDRLELRFETEGQESIYLGRVQDLTAEHIIIDRPIWISGPPAMTSAACLQATFMRSDAAYKFSSQLVNEVDSPPNGWCLSRPVEIERCQRRHSYRLAIKMPVYLTPLNESDTDLQPEVIGQLVELSTCGLRARVPVALEIDQLLLLWLDIPESEINLMTVGKIRRLCSEGDLDCDYGIEFYTSAELESLLTNAQRKRVPDDYTHHQENEKTALANFIFAEQVKLRRRGLL